MARKQWYQSGARGRGQRRGRSGAKGRRDSGREFLPRRQAAPYHFVPVVPDLALTDSPVLHEVQRADGDFWSGELRCTLTALTPLAVGHYQICFDKLSRHAKSLAESLKRLLNKRATTVRNRRNANPNQRIADDKTIFEPLVLSSSNGDDASAPGPLLIHGAAIKGMIRHSLAALLSAPMERVTERTFSYRPHLANAENVRCALVRKICPAQSILQVEYAGTPATPWSEHEKSPHKGIIFVEESAKGILEQWLVTNGFPHAARGLENLPSRAPLAEIKGVIDGVEIHEERRRSVVVRKLRRSPGGRAELSTYALIRSLAGIDGEGNFGRAHGGSAGYRWVLVPLESKESKIDWTLVEQYRKTIRHLADKDRGHLAGHPCPPERHSLACRCEKLFRPGDLIFVERDESGNPISVGHHFRYRWGYRDSVRHRRWLVAASIGEDTLRNPLRPLPVEQLADKISKAPDVGEMPKSSQCTPPHGLSAARDLFGYVGADNYSDAAPLTHGIGGGDFSTLAGRIAINAAIEQDAGRIAINAAIEQDADRPAEERFVNGDAEKQYFVPLKPLGAPKPSAVEHYLTQEDELLSRRKDRGILCTYGDTADDQSAGELRGRKFYLHQPHAATDASCYELAVEGSMSDRMSGEDVANALLSNQAGVARFVSRPGTQFRFTIRFRDLRAWELGALLFVLTADAESVHTLAESLELPEDHSARTWLRQWERWVTEESPLLALKLGHGRPLGLGSVHITVDSLNRLRFNEEMIPASDPCVGTQLRTLRCRLIDALGEHIRMSLGDRANRWAEQILKPWLQVHRYVARRAYDYPRGKRGDQAGGKIYEYHTELRRLHSRGRKQFAPQGPREAVGLKTLDELDNEEGGSDPDVGRPGKEGQNG